MKICEHDQYSPEWWSARRGLPTSSQFHRIVTAKKGDYSTQSRGYISELVAESLLPDYSTGHYQSAAMVAGSELEPDARGLYALVTGGDVAEVGLCISDCGRYGASPDAIVGGDGVLEIKCPDAKTHIGYLTANALPDDYRLQVNGHLLVTGREWCDFVSYSPDLPLFVHRVVRSEFTAHMGKAIVKFCDELDKAKANIERLMQEQGLLEEVA